MNIHTTTGYIKRPDSLTPHCAPNKWGNCFGGCTEEEWIIRVLVHPVSTRKRSPSRSSSMATPLAQQSQAGAIQVITDNHIASKHILQPNEPRICLTGAPSLLLKHILLNFTNCYLPIRRKRHFLSILCFFHWVRYNKPHQSRLEVKNAAAGVLVTGRWPRSIKSIKVVPGSLEKRE